MLEPNSSVQNLANLIRTIWIKERRRREEQLTGKPSRYALNDSLPRFDGGEDSAGRTHQNFWPRAASYCVAHGLNPQRWARFALSSFQATHSKSDRRRFADPFVLVSDTVREGYDDYSKELPERFRAELDSQSTTAMLRFRQRARCKELGYTRDESLTSVLLDLSLPLSALFRYSAAQDGGLPDVATHFFDAALSQYFFEKELYDDVWAEYVPTEMKQAADAAKKAFTA